MKVNQLRKKEKKNTNFGEQSSCSVSCRVLIMDFRPRVPIQKQYKIYNNIARFV